MSLVKFVQDIPSLATKVRPSVLRRDSSTSKVMIPSWRPLTHVATLVAPFDHVVVSFGVVMTKYAKGMLNTYRIYAV